MNWVNDLQKAISFIERNIMNEFGVEDVSDHLYFSKDYFQKVFAIVTGLTVGEYIRNRRLSLAARELANSGVSVVEVALKYMYETPESFTKAFARLHGYTPSQMRAGGVVPRYFHPISIQTIIKGGFDMNVEFDKQGERVLKAHDVALRSLVASRNDISGVQELVRIGLGSQEVTFLNDEMVIKTEGDMDCLQTTEYYTLPLRIDLTAKTDSTNIRLFYHAGELILNWECDPDTLGFHDIIMGNGTHYDIDWKIPPNEYADISWVIEKRYMEVYINGVSKFRHDEYPYIGMYVMNPRTYVTAPVRVGAAWGSTVTVRSLRVREL
jgi:AraC-like DNA-binding protein